MRGRIDKVESKNQSQKSTLDNFQEKGCFSRSSRKHRITGHPEVAGDGQKGEDNVGNHRVLAHGPVFSELRSRNSDYLKRSNKSSMYSVNDHMYMLIVLYKNVALLYSSNVKCLHIYLFLQLV